MEFMKPCPDQWLSATEISTLVNSPKNNSPDILEPAAPVGPSGDPQRLLFG
jgi:putative SOS response-associated peptidase YedK